MAAVASMRAIRTAGIEPDDIDLILLATLTPDYWMPSTAALVKEAIGNTRAAAMDVAAACSGSSTPTRPPRPTSRAGWPSHVLVIGAELLTRFLDYTDRSTCILFGDGAGRGRPVGVGRAGRRARHRADDRAAGRLHDLAAGRRREAPPSAETVARGEHYVRMEGKETYRFATRTLATTALESIRKSGLEPVDIDLFIPHQANIRIIEAVAKGLDLPMDRMFVNLDQYGNTSAASVPIALAEAVNEGRSRSATGSSSSPSGRASRPAPCHRVDRRPGARDRRRRRVRPDDVAGPAAGRLGLGRPDPRGPRRADARPGPVDVPLDDVVPASPSRPRGGPA